MNAVAVREGGEFGARALVLCNEAALVVLFRLRPAGPKTSVGYPFQVVESGKTLTRKIQHQRGQVTPIETRARVLFASGRHMFVPGDVGNRVALCQAA